MPNNKKAQLLQAMRLYLGGVDYVSFSAQQRLYNRVMRLVYALATDYNMDSSVVWKQAEDAARKEGIIRPRVGQHV